MFSTVWGRKSGRVWELCAHCPFAAVCRAVGLVASDFSNIFAIIVRATLAGTIAFMIRFMRPGITSERLAASPRIASETHCSTFIGFMGMVSGVRPKIASASSLCCPGRHNRHVDAHGQELHV